MKCVYFFVYIKKKRNTKENEITRNKNISYSLSTKKLKNKSLNSMRLIGFEPTNFEVKVQCCSTCPTGYVETSYIKF